jgi:hypothetical protein
MATLTVKLTDSEMRGLLCSALEGGSNYWYTIERHRLAKGVTYADFREGGRFVEPEYWHPAQLIPFHEGCATVYTAADDPDRRKYILDRKAMQRGTQIMAEKYPQHLADVLSENSDADTGDVWLQCCLFGELIYG